MTYRWTTDALHMFSKRELAGFKHFLDDRFRHYFLTYDNIRLLFNKETQRVNNQTHGDNGTSITLIEIHAAEAVAILSDYAQLYQVH